MSMRRAFLLALVSFALGACALPASAYTQRFSGTFDLHFETSSFHPDGGGGPYWVSFEGDTLERIAGPLDQSDDRGTWGQFHIVVEGNLSPEGHYGHLGGYRRELRVTRVIESRVLASRNPEN